MMLTTTSMKVNARRGNRSQPETGLTRRLPTVSVSNRTDCRRFECPETPWNWASRWVLAQAALTGTERVCDLGAGDNPILLAAFNERAAQAYLVDNLLLPEAKKLAPHVKRVQADMAQRLPFDDASLDIAVSVSVLEHLRQADRRAVLTEVQRVLKPGGRMIFTIGNLLRATTGGDDGDEAIRLLQTLPFFTDRHCAVHLPLNVPDMLADAPELALQVRDVAACCRCCPGFAGYDEEVLARDPDVVMEKYAGVPGLTDYPALQRILVCEVGMVLVKQGLTA